MLTAAPFPGVLPRDPADGWRLPYHNEGSPRTSAGWSLMGLPVGSSSLGTVVLRRESGTLKATHDRFLPGVGARMLASSAHPYLLDSSRVKQKTEGRLLPNHCRVMMPARASTCDSRRNGAAGCTEMAAIPRRQGSQSSFPVDPLPGPNPARGLDIPAKQPREEQRQYALDEPRSSPLGREDRD